VGFWGDRVFKRTREREREREREKERETEKESQGGCLLFFFLKTLDRKRDSAPWTGLLTGEFALALKQKGEGRGESVR
jgi:hypothetical protein